MENIKEIKNTTSIDRDQMSRKKIAEVLDTPIKMRCCMIIYLDDDKRPVLEFSPMDTMEAAFLVKMASAFVDTRIYSVDN